METTSETLLTFYMDPGNQALLRCPRCAATRCIEVQPDLIGKRKRCSCQCGEVFRYTIEPRTNFRKKVSLPGTYVNMRNNALGEMIVQDISIAGLGLKSLMLNGLKANDVLEVKFRLNDTRKSEVRRRVKVRSIQSSLIGTQFCDGKEFDRDIGFYLQG